MFYLYVGSVPERFKQSPNTVTHMSVRPFVYLSVFTAKRLELQTVAPTCYVTVAYSHITFTDKASIKPKP